MLTSLNKSTQKIDRKQSLLAIAFLLLVSIAAKASIDLGGLVSFTLQTLVIGIGYFFLHRNYRLLAILIYLIMGICDVQVFSEGSGWEYFSSWPLGFFLGFVIAVFITPTKGAWKNHLNYFILIHGIILLCGLFGLARYDANMDKIISTCYELLPGLIIKSLVGATITWWLDEKMLNKAK